MYMKGNKLVFINHWSPGLIQLEFLTPTRMVWWVQDTRLLLETTIKLGNSNAGA